MTRSVKRGLAVVMAAALAFSAPISFRADTVYAGTTTAQATVVSADTYEKDVVGDGTSAWWTAWSNYYKVTGDFKIAFSISMDKMGTSNWNTPDIMFATDADRAATGYTEYLVLRSDQYGFLGENNTAKGIPGVTYQLTSDWFTANASTGTEAVPGGTTADEAWTNWRALMKDGSIVYSIEKSGTTITVTETLTKDNKKYDCVTTLTLTTADSMRLFFIADGCQYTINGVSFTGDVAAATKNASTTATDSTNTATNTDNTTTASTTDTTSAETDSEEEESSTTKKTMKLSSVKVKKGTKKITGKVSVKKATVKIKVGKKAYKKATVSGKKFTLKTSKLKKGTKVTIKATKSGYKTLTKKYTVK